MTAPTLPPVSTLGQVFLASAAEHPGRVALDVDERAYTYQELAAEVRGLAQALLSSPRTAEDPNLTAVLGQRSLAGFVGILGAAAAGDGYVPILPTFPAARIRAMLERAGARRLVVDGDGLALLPEILPGLSLDVFVPPPAELAELAAAHPNCRFHPDRGPAGDDAAVDAAAAKPAADQMAYLLFTSGSTGVPKGVMVAHRNILRYLDVVVEQYGLTFEDRFSHLFDVTFDLSLFDIFVCFRVGGALCCPDKRARLLPASYVEDAKLTVWFSVPSTALLMKKTRTLAPGVFPGLRYALFCGEALPMEVAEAFASAAQNAVVENLYGPTELTLSFTSHRLSPESAAFAENGVVPIGQPYPGMQIKVVGDDLREVEAGEAGELLASGPQCALGYLNDAEKTGAAFVIPPGESEIFYRTGDRVRRPRATGEPLVYLGRIDHQIKIRGYRVELGEVEAVLRREAGVDAAVVVGWPQNPGGADGLVGFLDRPVADEAALRARMAEHLPVYMVPRRIRELESFPLNSNGKIDRGALLNLLRSP